MSVGLVVPTWAKKPRLIDCPIEGARVGKNYVGVGGTMVLSLLTHINKN